MLRSGALLFAAAVLLGSVGCVATDDTYDEAESVAAADGKADAASELRVRAGDTTVWMTTALARVEDDRGLGCHVVGELELVLLRDSGDRGCRGVAGCGGCQR